MKPVEHAASRDARLAALVESVLPGARISAVTALGADSGDGASSTNKAAGYGAPLRIDVELDGVRRRFVLHTATSNRFGHDRRADRAADAVLAADDLATIPRHVRTLDVGAFRPNAHVSLRGTGEFYVLTEWGEGTPYAEDLRRIARTGVLADGDLLRVERMARYLAALHRERVTREFARERALRDLLGSGEGIFGIVDGYPESAPGVTASRLRHIEELCLAQRWKLKRIARPLVRTHGDFHPFNVLFDAASELVLLDTSRGSMGDAADDVICMAVNFPFFALSAPGSWQAAFGHLYRRFFEVYLAESGDEGLFDVAAPFVAWRGLVLASPIWYPDLPAETRRGLLDFVEQALTAERFSPDSVEGMFT
jgi:aminoglycoside phosphotransferase (APT) family kinase protein